MKPVAHNQADLYGLFFNRDEKRVQVYVTEKRETCTWQQKVGRNRAKALLEKFRRVDRGELPLAPRQWKCKGCQFRSGCPLVPV
jgi:CRISPR/Cas system-associated exonuclease Cas4 (RecB family)